MGTDKKHSSHFKGSEKYFILKQNMNDKHPRKQIQVSVFSANTVLHWKWLLEVFIKQNNECHESKCLPEILVEAQARQVVAKCQGWRC